MSSQKVVIPKWMINPEEVTVIEIPAKLKSLETVIIKPKLAANDANKANSAEPNLLQKLHVTPKKLNNCAINIPEWNEYFARAVRRRSDDREKALSEEEVSEEEEEDEDTEEETEVYKTESEPEPVLDYECVRSTYNQNNFDALLKVLGHPQDLTQNNDESQTEKHRQKLMRTPYSNVDQTGPNVLTATGKRIEQVADLLDLVEKFEYSKIHSDLKDFQRARRKLVFSTTKLSTTPCFTIAP